MGFISQSLQDKLTKSTHKSKGSSVSASQEEEQQFSILPHPAQSNDPADLQTNSAGAQGNLFMPGPVVPTQEQGATIPPPAGRDELHARSTKLNQK